MEKLTKLNKLKQEELVPEMARLLLRNENQKSDGFTDGKEWDELDPTDKNELLCRACEILDQDWDEYCRNYQISNTRRWRDLSPDELRKRAS